MGQLAIVNAPSSFSIIWGILKPWLSKETVEKVDILGSDYQKVLLGLIDKENLPTSLGGECECEGGCEYSFAGPWKEGTEERRSRRKREAGTVVEEAIAINGVPPGEEKDESKEVPVAAPIKSPQTEATEANAGNGNITVTV